MANNRELSQFASVVGYNGGNIGIGTDSMSSALQIYAADTGEGTAKGQITLKDTAAYNQTPTGGIVFQGHHTAGAQAIFAGIRGFKANTGNGDYDGCLAFDVRKHGAVAYEAMRINEDGNIGINETAPAYKLSVGNGDIATMKNVSAAGGNAVDMLRFRVENSSNTTQKATLGGISAETVSSWGGSLTFHTKPANGTPNDSVTERLRIESDGQVVINRSSGAVLGNTSSKLEVFNSTENLIFVSNSTAATGQDAGIMFGPANNVYGGKIIVTSDEDFSTSANRTAHMAFHTRKDGTAAEKLRIDSSGRLLVGHSSLTGDSDSAYSRVVVNGNTTATSKGGILSLENTATAISSVNNGNQIGQLFFKTETGEEFGLIKVEAEANATSSSCPARMMFSTTASSATTPTERMRITNGGTVRIGDSLGSNAAGRFQVVEERSSGDDNDCNAYFETNRQDWNIKTYYNRAGTHYHAVFVEQGTERGSIRGSDGSNVTFNQGSDYRWKENIVEMTGTEGIEICKRLKPSKYNWIENREQTGEINTVDGFIAHEVVEAGVLGAVVGEKDAVNEDGSIKGQLLDYGQMTPVLAAAIKGLIAKVETLETQNADLLARVTALEGS